MMPIKMYTITKVAMMAITTNEEGTTTMNITAMKKTTTIKECGIQWKIKIILTFRK
jgi:hypothetical protein